MANMHHVCFVLLLAVSGVHSDCYDDDKWRTRFDVAGHTECKFKSHILSGFYRSNSWNGGINYIDKGICCSFPPPYKNDQRNVQYADWHKTLDSNYVWALCPRGYFLGGFYRSQGNWLANIEEGRCIKPASAPARYGHCERRPIAFDKEGSVKCKDGYFVTGIHKSSCNYLRCLDQLTCCKLAPKAITVDGLESAKLKVMDNTLVHIADLAKYLGYGNPSGCGAAFVGENFRRDGDSWKADSSRQRCYGEKPKHRLTIKYGDWKFVMKDIKFAKPVINDLKAEIMTSGDATNLYCSEVVRTVTHETSVVTTVTHTATSAWSFGVEASFSIGYSGFGVTASASVGFSYSQSSSRTNQKGSETATSYNLQDQVHMKPNSMLKWTAMLFKSRKSVAYTATILIHFSVELSGYLRYAGGYDGNTKAAPNYYFGERGRKEMVTKDFTFGGKKKAFYTDLKKQSDLQEDPWMWGDMEANNPAVAAIVKALVNEARYEFTLTGQFDEVTGKEVQMKYEQQPLNNTVNCDRRKRAAEPPKYLVAESNTKVHHVEARATPEDEPAPVLKPPVVVIPDVPDDGIPDHIDIIDSDA